MGESRTGERRPGKPDQIDALAIARAAVADGIRSSRPREGVRLSV
jgi:transposase